MDKPLKKLLIVTVGTSLLEKKFDSFDGATISNNLQGFDYDAYNSNDFEWNDYVKKFYEGVKNLNIKAELVKRNETNPVKYRANPDNFPAEISSMLLLFSEEGYVTFNNSDINVINTHPGYDIHFLISETDECKYCARSVQRYFNEKIKVDNGLLIPHVNLHIVNKLSENSTTFNEGLKNFLDKVHEISTPAYPEIIINITTGYKGVIPYMVLAGMCYERTRIIYLYENSVSIIKIPKLPVKFDLAGWNDNRAFLKVLASSSKWAQFYSDPEKLPVPPEFQTLFARDDSGISLSPFGKFLQEKYLTSKREKALSEFGRGFILAEMIRDDTKREMLKNWIRNSQNIWYGDNIPEAVDHSRGHCQRLLELAAHIIRPIEAATNGQFLSEDELIVLTIVLWFHDIGHSGRKMIKDINDSTVTKLLNGDKDGLIDIDISDFPTANRDLHHILGFIEALREPEYYGFKNDGGDGYLPLKYLKPAIYAYLYHRKKMPKNDNGNDYFEFPPLGIKIQKPIPDSWKNETLDIRLRFLAALQAFIDECDNSRERTGDEEFKMRRTRQTEREIETEYEKMKGLYDQFKNDDEEDFEPLVSLFKDSNGNFRSDEELKELSKKLDLTKTKINSTPIGELLDCLIKKCFNDKSNDLLFKEMTKTLNKIIFKLIQNWHMDKSDKYSSVFFIPEKKNANLCFHIGIESENNIFDQTNEFEEESKNIDNIIIIFSSRPKDQAIKDICEQYKKVKDILEKNGIKFERIFWYKDGKQQSDGKEILKYLSEGNSEDNK
ncbi:MAG: hypothetical protein IBX72_09760 [Nitrospirae bacterium]|nr:hypothetical protein [Nitrospirota bacterium]